MKILSLELANVKRIKALRLVPTSSGLTIIGGNNAAGKTSVLDAIAFAFGGKKYQPTNLRREGSVGETLIRVETDNGLIVERKGKNASLTVTDKEGKRGGQAILDAFLSEISIDLPRFHNSSSAEKARLLLQTLGIGEELERLDREEKAKYDTRTVIGRQADQKEKAAKDMPWHEDVPAEPVSVAELISKQQSILAQNGANAKMRDALRRYSDELEDIKAKYAELEKREKFVKAQIEANRVIPADESTAELERQIADFETTNRKINENAERTRREEEAVALHDQYDALTKEIETIRSQRMKLIENANLPLPGLSVADGQLLYLGKAWDCMSGAQQLMVDCAIASRLNPECRFVLLDKLEQMDLDTLDEFGKWLEAQDLQCIATRVSVGDECSIVIEDGEAKENPSPKQPELPDEY